MCIFVTRHSTDLVTTRLRARAYDSHKHPAVGDGDDAEGDEVDEDEDDDGVVPAGGALWRQVQRQADARAAVEAPEVVETRQRHAGQQQAQRQQQRHQTAGRNSKLIWSAHNT